MRKALLVLMTFVLCLSLTGCEESNYEKAQKLYDEGDYAKAQEIFLKLGDYEDSEAMAEVCRSRIAWRTFADYVQEKVQYSVQDNEGNAMLITCDGSTIYVGCNLDWGTSAWTTGTWETTYALWLPEGEVKVQLMAESTLYIQSAYITEKGTTEWNVATYQQGDSITWDECKVSGKQANGAPVASNAEGLLTLASAHDVECLTNLLAKALSESGTGTTMKDLGFLMY